MQQGNRKTLLFYALWLSSFSMVPGTTFGLSHTPEFEITVMTSSRQAQSLTELAESVGVLDEITIEEVSPGHPSDLLNRVSGVHVNDMGGEGHMTAIRQPISTGGVYLFLEDGLPTRPTGFFNHNGLYEIDIPNAAGVEVTKGPGSALYGSDAIGGIFNVLTPRPTQTPTGRVNLEGGSDGWRRGLISSSGPVGERHAYHWQLNYTQSDGFREQSDYDRLSSSARIDTRLSDRTSVKTLISFGQVDQSGGSTLSEEDYRTAPERNYYHGDMGLRDVRALRLSSEWTIQLSDQSQLMVTPFFRDNSAHLMPSWMLSYDPVINRTEFQSYGLLAQYSQTHETQTQQTLEWTTGIDVDYTPAEFSEQQIVPVGAGDLYLDYQRTGRSHYDYRAEQTSISPYAQLQYRPSDTWVFSLGARYDHFEVDYTDRLPESVPQQTDSGSWLRPNSQRIRYSQVSPKLGAVWKFTDGQQLYLNRRHAFRVPSVGQVFRPGSSQDTTDLSPVTAVSHELGWRGQFERLRLDAALYQLKIEDDVVTYITDSDRRVTNAGQTSHQGIELGLHWHIADDWHYQGSATVTRQEYDDFQYLYSCFPPQCVPPVQETRNFSGFEVGKAPRQIWQSSLAWSPSAVPGWRTEVEWQRVGGYFTDETNTRRYPGHSLWHLRSRYELSDTITLAARLMNLTDETYSTYTSNQVGSEAIEYRPGMPRSLFASLTWSF